MTKKRLRAKIDNLVSDLGLDDEGILLADGFERAFIGFTSYQPNRPICAVYDYPRCVRILQNAGMKYAEAIEYIEFNTLGAWVGEHTPMFINRY